MPESSTANLLNSLVQLATPFAQKFAFGEEKAGDIALQQERNRYNALNGSGPTSPALATNQAPRGLLDYLFGDPAARSTGGTSSTSQAPSILSRVMPLAILGAVVAGAIWILKKVF